MLHATNTHRIGFEKRRRYDAHMTLFAIVLALLLEQARPLNTQTPVYEGVRAWTRWVSRMLDAGQQPYAWVTWLVAVLVPAVLAWLLYAAFHAISVVLGFAWMVGVLYLTLGFRQFSFHFTNVRVALESGDERGAREALREWTQDDTQDLSKDGVLRQTLTQGVLSAHRHVFGVVVCFVLLAGLGLGPAGAVVYRLAQHVVRRWQDDAHNGPSPALKAVAQRAWCVLDWLPSRITGMAFAVVGHFEEAVANWRQESGQPGCSNDSVLLAAAAGAMNVRLAPAELDAAPTPTQEPQVVDMAVGGDASQPDVGVAAQGLKLAHLSTLVGLVWRSVVLVLVLLLLGTLARFW
jgi:adenosylcobinamide-phosphate synthase